MVTVTSALPGEGHELIAANLALIAAAESREARVLLVDADVRRPSLHRLFGVPAAPGLGELSAGATTLESALRAAGPSGLSLIAAGEPGAGALPSAALGQQLTALRARFDLIYIAAPPLLVNADGAFLARAGDGTLLVILAGETSRQSVAEAIDVLGDAPLLGCVLNGARPRRALGRPGG